VVERHRHFGGSLVQILCGKRFAQDFLMVMGDVSAIEDTCLNRR
jgi:hypothetical protein